MAVPSRKNQMVKRLMQNIKTMKRERSIKEKEKMDAKKEPISEEEHQKRMQMLKEIGLVK